MHQGPDGPSQDYRSTTVGFGRLAYDPLTKTFWYYGYGRAVDQGGTYAGPTNFGCAGLDGFIAMLKNSLEFARPDIERLTQERVDERNDKGSV